MRTWSPYSCCPCGHTKDYRDIKCVRPFTDFKRNNQAKQNTMCMFTFPKAKNFIFENGASLRLNYVPAKLLTDNLHGHANFLVKPKKFVKLLNLFISDPGAGF